MASGTWRLAASLAQYRAEVNARWPNRDRRSDGTIGDAAHATRSSDHNPWLKKSGVGVVRAVDVDKDLTGPGTDARPATEARDAEWLAEFLRGLGKARDPRLVGGGYIIWRGRIASEVAGWSWRPYDGPNAHMHHLHLSVTRNPDAFDSAAPWGITASSPTTPARFLPMLNDAEQRELLDGVRDCRRELTQRLGSRVPGSTTTDTILGWAINADAQGAAANARLDKLVQTLLDTPLEGVMSFRDGKLVTDNDKVTVGYLLRRAAEGSGARQKLDALLNATTTAAAAPTTAGGSTTGGQQ